MKFLISLLFLFCCNNLFSQQLKATVKAKPAKRQTALLHNTDSAKNNTIVSPAVKVFTKKELSIIAVKKAITVLYHWQMFDDAFGYYNNNNVAAGMDSISINSFTDTTVLFTSFLITPMHYTRYRCNLLLDTVSNLVTNITILNYRSYYITGVKEAVVDERPLYSYQFYYNQKKQPDSIVQFDKINRPVYVYRVLPDISCNRLEKRQIDNNNLWFVAWLNEQLNAADSIQNFTYSSGDPYKPLARDRNYFTYENTTHKPTTVAVYSEDEVTYRGFNYTKTFFDYLVTGQIDATRTYKRSGRSGGLDLPVSLTKYFYNEKGQIAKQIVNGFSAHSENTFPTDIPSNSIPTQYSYVYNNNGNIYQSVEFYEDKCITKNNLTEYILSENKFIKGKKETPNLITRCKY